MHRALSDTHFQLIVQSRFRMIDNRDAVFRKIRDKKSLMDNETSLHDISLNEEYILDRTDVRVIFITLYSIVFVFCFIGNSMVIFVVTFSRRLRSITNFFLANLAVADFCVGIFCVYQTLTNYLMNSWRLGDFLCKVYMFVHALSYTASVLILMVVCIERYLAIVYPIKCRSVLTRSRLQLVIGIVWIVAAIYALPRFFYVETIQNRLITGDVDIICIANIQKHNKTLLDVVNLVFLYLLPLLLMCCLYTRIAVGLWRSGTTLGGPGLATKSKNDSLHRVHSSGRNVLRARRGVIRMLIAVVMMFAICNLPQQARIAWRHWSSSYDRSSNFSTLLTLSTFLISYTNSCLNPFLYAFLSRNFRKGIRELLNCGKARNRSSVLVMGRTARETATRQENDEGKVNDFRRSSLVCFSSDRDSSVAVPPSTEQTIYEKSSY
ncbi:trissin receptor-like isoform X1 [Bombus pascuorum]|uniref:trissin receptor-like isoform X1 n=2 Tax=Bombus pascuorum TaxID=65598 RepID=UPI0021464D92|nr:trissin receptor-like isoform X1 [Bombus pascuorum]XP_060829847.1 trissin receptor-like isoform X1 [Bombus pascuorum]